MLLLTEEELRRRADIGRDVQDGKLGEVVAGRQMIEINPEDGAGYAILAAGLMAEGDAAGAEETLWKALPLRPLDSNLYLLMAELQQKRGVEMRGSPYVRLGLTILAAADEILDVIAERFQDAMGKTGLDFSQSWSYDTLVVAAGEDRPLPADEEERLRPYRMLVDFDTQASRVVDSGLLDRMRDDAEECAPLLRSVLRNWARFESGKDVTAALAAAVLGEIGGSDAVSDLLEMGALNNDLIFLHANWAALRMGQRFPRETLEAIRSLTADAGVSLRCGLAEHLNFLRVDSGVDTALVALLEGFPTFANDNSAPYLLWAVGSALRRRGFADQAKDVVDRFGGFVPEDGREWIDRIGKPEFEPRLANEGLTQLTFEDILLERALIDDEDDEDEDEAPPRVRPGRNEPCWCGSGKKYKKCHLELDEEYDRDQRELDAEEEEEWTPDDETGKLLKNLMMFAGEQSEEEDFDRAREMYYGPETPDIEAVDDAEVNFLEWYVFDFQASSGRTVVEEYLRRFGRNLQDWERTQLEAWRHPRFGLYEVKSLDGEGNAKMADVCDGETFNTMRSERDLGEVFLGRLLDFEGRQMFGADLQTVPRNLLPALLENIEEERRETGQSAAEFVRANSHRMHRLVKELERQN